MDYRTNQSSSCTNDLAQMIIYWIICEDLALKKFVILRRVEGGRKCPITTWMDSVIAPKGASEVGDRSFWRKTIYMSTKRNKMAYSIINQ